jgi:uncharacterized protein (TIGR03437 family)
LSLTPGELKFMIGYTITQTRVPALKPGPRQAAPCDVSKRVTILLASHAPGFSAQAGVSESVEAYLIDACAGRINTGSIFAEFSNGDPPIELKPDPDGRWTGVWIPQQPAEAVLIELSGTLEAFDVEPHASTGSITQSDLPLVSAVAHAATFSESKVIAPGGHITLFGSSLATQAAPATALPLPTTLGATTVYLGGRQLPLLYAGLNQVNAVLPLDLPQGAELPLYIRSGDKLSASGTMLVGPAQPGIFTVAGTGAGQGHVYRAGADGSLTLAGESSPAKPGDVVVIYATGLGAVDSPVPAGAATPTDKLYRATGTVKLFIGGREAEVRFAGLAPGMAGVYQINAIVPEIGAAKDLPVVLTVNDIPSPPVTISVAP